MTVEKEEQRSKSPVHVTVDDETPVHVHVKKPTSKKIKASYTHGHAEVKHGRKTPTNSKRTVSPARERWVPPPARTSTSKVAFQAEDRVDHEGGNDTEEEDRTVRKMRHYEKRIGQLMTEVGSLKAQSDNQTTRGRQALRTRSRSQEGKTGKSRSPTYAEYRQSSTSPLRSYSPTLGYPTSDLTAHRVLLEKEDELLDTRRELIHSDREKSWLRRSMEHLQDEAISSKQTAAQLAEERDQLMRKLIQVEMDGQAAATQLGTLRDTVRRLREETNMSKTDRELLQQQRELLMDRLGDFEGTNRSLRQMLRDRHEHESNELRLQEQREALLERLGETEDRLQNTRSQILEKDREILRLQSQLDGQRQENMAFSGIQTSLETTRAHLQKHLRQKEGDCNRMAVQIRSLESQLAQERIENDHLQTLLVQAKEKSGQDKEALKKATRVQKTRATRSEDAVENLQSQVLERDAMVTDLREQLNEVKSRCEKLSKEKTQLFSEKSTLKGKLNDLQGEVMQLEDESKSRLDTSEIQFHEKATEASRLTLETEELRSSLRRTEIQLKESDEEIAKLRKSVRQYESLVEEYRVQMNRSRREADETLIQLDEQKRELSRVQRDGEMELDKVKSRLQARLQELEPIPELMRMTEFKLQDATEQLVQLERSNAENNQIINELTDQLSKTTSDLDDASGKLRNQTGNSQQMETRLEAMLKRLREMDEENKDLLQKLHQRDEAVHQANVRVDESSRENVTLARQLEELLMDARRHSETTREKSSAKDRTWQSRMSELEQQLTAARTEIARVRREKEEAERKCNSRLYDLKDRLEQSHSTNRSLQNYIQFLKNSYANVFGDATLPASAGSHLTALF